MSSSSTVGIVGSLLADLLRTFGYSSTSFFSLLGFLLKSYFPFWRLVNAFLWVCILFLRRCALSCFLVFEALVWRFCFSSGTCSTFFLEVEFLYHERVALLGVPFGEGLLLDCGSSSCSSPSFIVSFSDSGLRDNGFLHCSRISFLHGTVCAVLEVAVRSHRLLLDLFLGGNLGCGFFS